jgi:hypothetical protein
LPPLRLVRIVEHRRGEHAGDRRLFDHLAVITRVQIGKHATDRARLLDERRQVGAGSLAVVEQLEHGILDPARDQRNLERALVLEVLLGLAAAHFVERRLGDVEVSALDQRGHLTEEERQQQRANMGAVDVGVGHDDDAVIAQLVGVEILADAGAERSNQRSDLLARQHLVDPRAFDIEDLAPQRQHRLKLAITALLGGAAGGIALHDE